MSKSSEERKKIREKLKEINLIKNYRKMYPYVKPYLGRAILALLIAIPIGSMDAVIAWVMKPYMDTVMLEQTIRATSFLPILIVAFSAVQSLLTYAANYLNSWVGNRITLDLKLTLFNKMLRNDPAYFDKNSSGEIMIRFNGDADSACSGLLSNLKLFTTRLFSSLSLIGVLLWNSWQLTIIAMIFLFGALYPLGRIRHRIKGIMQKSIMTGSQIMSLYNESFIGNRVITSYNLYDYRARQFSETLRTVFRLGMKMVKRTGLLTPMMHISVSMGIAGVIWYGSCLIAKGQLTPGGFVSFITALLLLYHPVKSMGTSFTNVQISLLAMDRVFEKLEEYPAIQSKPDAIKLQKVKQGIEYQNVWFEYEPNRPVLKGVSLTIPKGSTIAFVGNSGGGKTTFVNLLPRFYDVSSGSIKIDGTDIRDLDLYSLRDKIAVVFQDNILFAGTIRDNILLGNENATEEELKKAVSYACLDEFIASLPNGLDTEIGERGVLLSGGQRQRIAIARAFIKDAPIVILDEATSALDNKSEQIVQQAIYNLMKDRTVFVVAHRLSTVRNADKIVVVNHGEIVETGTHDELIAMNDSIYASLYRTQLK